MFMDKMFELYLLHPGWMIPLTVLVVIGGTIWHERRTATGRYNKKVPTYVLYALMDKLCARGPAYLSAVTNGEGILNGWLLLDGFSNPRFYGQFLTLALPLLV